MKEFTILQKIKQWIAGIAFKVFIWGNETTPESYWEDVYLNEKAFMEVEELERNESCRKP